MIDDILNTLANNIANKVKVDHWGLGQEPFFSISQTTFGLAVLDWHKWQNNDLSDVFKWLENRLSHAEIIYPRTLAWPLYLIPHRFLFAPQLRDNLIKRLMNLRNEDGGWGHGALASTETCSGFTDPFPTAISVLGLVESGESTSIDVSDHIRTGTEYLCQWWVTRHHELFKRPGTWAISLLAVRKAEAHVCESNEIITNAHKLAGLVCTDFGLEIEKINNAARHLDSPYFLLSSAWTVAALAESATLETLFHQIELLSELRGLIQSGGNVGLVPNDSQTHIYTAFNVYFAFRTFQEIHGKSKLLENLLAKGKEAQKFMTEHINNPVRVFIGSSVEGIDIARKIRSNFEHDSFDVVIWEDGIFTPSSLTIESLEKAKDDFDFAILILTPDDLTKSRDAVHPSIRDNLLFEVGLFMGALGRKRVFLVRPRINLKWPTDFLGITPVDYDEARFLRDPRAAVNTAADKIRDIIKSTGAR